MEFDPLVDKEPQKITVDDVLEYIDDLFKNVPLDNEEYYDYLEKSQKTTQRSR